MGTAVNELSSAIRGVDMPPEDIEQLFVGDPLRIIGDLNSLNMTRSAVVFVGWVFS